MIWEVTVVHWEETSLDVYVEQCIIYSDLILLKDICLSHRRKLKYVSQLSDFVKLNGLSDNIDHNDKRFTPWTQLQHLSWKDIIFDYDGS